jgi:subtilisin family serine protease
MADESPGQYYYVDGKQTPLELVTDVVTILPNELSSSAWADILEAHEAIRPDMEPERLSVGYYLLHLYPDCVLGDVLAALRSLERVTFAYPAYSPAEGSVLYLTHHVGVLFSESVSEAQVDSVGEAFGLQYVNALFHNPRFLHLALEPHSVDSPLDVANVILENGLAEIAVPGFISDYATSLEPNDSYWNYQWHFKNTGQTGGSADADIDLDEALDFTLRDTSLIIAVLDQGIAAHVDQPESRLIRGWNYAGATLLDSLDTTPGSDQCHGMATSGMIAASTDNGIGISSVAGHYVVVLIHQVFSKRGGIVAPNTQLADAISDAVDSGAVIISNSWGGTIPDSYIDQAISDAVSGGTVVVFAAGNEGLSPVAEPGNHSDAIAVGASDSVDNRWQYSQFGDNLDVLAPSAKRGKLGHLWSLDTPGREGCDDGSANCDSMDADYLCQFGGTSAACPQVAGVAALIMLRRPDLIGQPDSIRDIIRYSSEREQYGGSDTSRVNNYVGWGRVNAARALLAVSRGDADNNASINVSDINYLIDFVHGSGDPPLPTEGTGDCDCNSVVNVSVVVWLVQYVFGSGNAPRICFRYDY